MPEHHPIEAVILCGGLGTRFREVSNDAPKSLARVNETPFLDCLLDYFSDHGIKRFILCTGYLSEIIEKYYESSPYTDSIMISKEDTPLGTAGAIKNAEKYLSEDYFIAANGDSYCNLNLRDFIQFHFSLENPLISVALSNDPERTDAGRVELDKTTSKITAFYEKSKISHNLYINSGIYIMRKNILDDIPQERAYSLEYELFPKFINRGLYGYRTNQPVIDIGTKERFEKAQHYFKNL